MKKNGMIAPSMMCAAIEDLRSYLEVFAKEGIDYLHVDIMDGTFVPNIMLGVDYVKQLRQLTNIPLDIHMMVENPEDKIDWFDFQPGEMVSIHIESTKHSQRALQKIKETGASPFIALNPGTAIHELDYIVDDIKGVLAMTVNPGFAGQKLIPQTIQKIRDIREYLDCNDGAEKQIEVDGNVSWNHIDGMTKAGADIFVVGSSSVFDKKEILEKNIRKFRKLVAAGGREFVSC